MLIEYFDFHPEMVATCECGWAGRGRDTEIELYESPWLRAIALSATASC
jgi:hypothetical protein